MIPLMAFQRQSTYCEHISCPLLKTMEMFWFGVQCAFFRLRANFFYYLATSLQRNTPLHTDTADDWFYLCVECCFRLLCGFVLCVWLQQESNVYFATTIIINFCNCCGNFYKNSMQFMLGRALQMPLFLPPFFSGSIFECNVFRVIWVIAENFRMLNALFFIFNHLVFSKIHIFAIFKYILRSNEHTTELFEVWAR